MNIWATGLTGTIGRKLPTQVRPLGFSKNGITQKDLLKIKKGDVVLHLAAIVGEQKCLEDSVLSKKINVTAARISAEQIIQIPNTFFIYVSTGHVYGRRSIPAKENDQLNPETLYADLKLKGEFEAQKIFSADLNRLAILRVFSIMDNDLPHHALPSRILRILNGLEPTPRIKHSNDVRDFLSLDEIVTLMELIWSQKFPGIVNICSGIGISVKEACIEFGKKMGYGDVSKIIEFENSYSELPFLVGDRSILNQFLNVT